MRVQRVIGLLFEGSAKGVAAALPAKIYGALARGKLVELACFSSGSSVARRCRIFSR